jgi:hypothetical protein
MTRKRGWGAGGSSGTSLSAHYGQASDGQFMNHLRSPNCGCCTIIHPHRSSAMATRLISTVAARRLLRAALLFGPRKFRLFIIHLLGWCLLLREAALRFSHDQILILAERLNPPFFSSTANSAVTVSSDAHMMKSLNMVFLDFSSANRSVASELSA